MCDVLVMFEKSDLLPMVITEEHIRKISDSISGTVYWCKDEKDALENHLDAEVLFTWGGSGEMPETYCCQSKKLKWFSAFSAGVNPIMDGSISRLPIRLTNAKGIHGRTMALTTIGYIISFLRRFPELQRRQQRHEWSKRFEEPMKDTEGLTVAVVGAGAIGGEVARLSQGIGMRTIGVKRNVMPLPYFDEVYAVKDLDLALEQADFVVIVTPLTDDTYHLIDKERLEHMKSSAVLINIGRGPVVDENALVEALQKGIIGGAALDAVEKEPLAADSPLWDMDNVILTPHCSADSDKYMDRAVDLFCENLRRYEAGEPLLNEIDLKQKY